MNLLKAPTTYKPGTYGGWELKVKKTTHNAVAASYFSGIVKLPNEIPVLYDNKGTLWMSVTIMELESQFLHNKYAHGNVVVMGAGLGVLPFNLLQNPKVKSVTIVEKSASLFMEWAGIVGLHQWRNADKLTLVNADAREWKGECDTLLADIWPAVGDEALEADMATFRGNVRFARMMCWGAEIAFIDWCRENDISVRAVKQEDAERWSKESGHYVWRTFARDAVRAAFTMVRSFMHK